MLISFNFPMSFITLLMILFFSIVGQSHGNEDLYGVLGVSKSASLQEIKRAYKNLAKEW